MECHTPMVKGHPDLKNRMSAGGRKFKGPWGEVISANITQDKATGIGSWTNDQIKWAITKGVFHNGAKMRPPMCYRCYDKMTEADVDAVVSHLRTIKPIKNNLR